MPCQPTHFWNDENGNKYRKAYFSRFSGVWAHGDYCKINPQTGGIVMLGRRCFTHHLISPSVEAFEEVSDSLCVPQYNKHGEERVVLFLKMGTNHEFRPDLVKRIREAIRYTLSGKKVEVAVKQVIAGKEVAKRDVFSNPEALDLYRNIPELQDF
ncbi:putative Acetoacetyl-CoA synthetase-like protein [Naja naja]|nr:putative Acetoacetyl-CoA synthetase-like protein [Naja naja]